MNDSSIENVIIEIRAGTGGDESALFVADLLKMYSKYAESQKWSHRILESNPNTIGGFKEVVLEISGPNAFSELQYEGGVHRVQRTPKTEKKGRIHTSTTTVAVFKKQKHTTINIKPDDLRVDFYRSSGAGGQNVNKRETAVRITHIPTGAVASSQSERSQSQNKDNAMAILEAKIAESMEKKDFDSLDEKRKIQVGWAKRSEKIRTYNFPQNRITDHRIKKSWHNLEDIIEGDLKKIIKAFQKAGY